MTQAIGMDTARPKTWGVLPSNHMIPTASQLGQKRGVIGGRLFSALVIRLLSPMI